MTDITIQPIQGTHKNALRDLLAEVGKRQLGACYCTCEHLNMCALRFSDIEALFCTGALEAYL